MEAVAVEKVCDFDNLERFEKSSTAWIPMVKLSEDRKSLSVCYRHYNPETGRFLSEDSTGIDGFNLYLYAKNNPINYIDFSGDFSINFYCAVLGVGTLIIDLAGEVYAAYTAVQTAQEIAKRYREQASKIEAKLILSVLAQKKRLRYAEGLRSLETLQKRKLRRHKVERLKELPILR